MTSHFNNQSVPILYGKGHVDLTIQHTGTQWDVIQPREVVAAEDPKAAFLRAARAPEGTRPLAELKTKGRVCIVTSDGTRPVPNKQLIPWIVEELGVDDSQVCILIGTGSHRPNNDAEMLHMFGEEIIRRFEIVNHNAFVPEENVAIGEWADGGQVSVDRVYTEADLKIVLGFIEPHFFAGFSGGSKGIVPGVASIDTILRLHRYAVIAHERNTWGILDGNPTQNLVREAVSFCPPDFMVNVALNNKKQITEVFAGDVQKAHDVGCAHVKETSMIPVEARYPLVVTSTSGYPLDQNLYQSVKAVSVADRIVEPGGTIVLVCECSDGLPDHGNFGALFRKGLSSEELLKWIASQETSVMDQWQAQILAMVANHTTIHLYSKLDQDLARMCYMNPVEDLQECIDSLIKEQGITRAAVLPEGPLTIPWVREAVGVEC